jgi:cyclopropane-fatty-acyl-phospholipid synthase
MSRDYYRRKVERLLSLADVEINRDRAWDLEVHNDELYRRVLAEGSLGWGDAYVEGWWDCEALDDLFHRVFEANLDAQFKSWFDLFPLLRAKISNLQKRSRSFQIGERHYDTGNRLFEVMLGKYMIYSCGYWRRASTLDEAQEAKLDLVCRKLHLKPGMRVLDIGCGWGGTARFAVERYQVEVVGITVSKEQRRYARELCNGLPVEIRLQDYRDLRDRFDRVLSLGMFEHVGYKNYPTFMRVVRNCLEDEGLFLLHTIGRNQSATSIDPWIGRHIFPNAMLPSAGQISSAFEGLFVLEDWQSFGADYDRTLMQWFRNFDAHWDTLAESYDERFYRKWKYYLLSCAGRFRSRRNQLWQIVLSPKGVPGGYQSVR